MAAVVVWAVFFLSLGLRPYSFEWPPDWRLHTEFYRRDSIRNFVMFVPFGFMITPLFRRAPLLATGIFCFLLSGTVEFGQQFLPRRYPSVPDLVCNTFGGLSGAAALLALERLWRAIRQVSQSASGR